MNAEMIEAKGPLVAKSLGNALEWLGQKIAFGELLPGEKIRQQEMAEQLGISRVPLREATESADGPGTADAYAQQGLLRRQEASVRIATDFPYG